MVGPRLMPTCPPRLPALLHSLCRTISIVDGNERLAWTACQVFLGLNGEWVTASDDDRFNLMIAVASGAVDEVHTIAAQLRTWCV